MRFVELEQCLLQTLLLCIGYTQAELLSAVHGAVHTLSYSVQCTVLFIH